jgi:hypothetical protein
MNPSLSSVTPPCLRQVLKGFHSGVLAQHDDSRIAGDKMNEQENEDGHSQQSGNQRNQSANNVSSQWGLSLSATAQPDVQLSYYQEATENLKIKMKGGAGTIPHPLLLS